MLVCPTHGALLNWQEGRRCGRTVSRDVFSQSREVFGEYRVAGDCLSA